MSAGQFFDLIRPAVLVVSAVISTWVLLSASKRFRLYQAFAWALATFVFPLVVVPLYLATLLVRQPPKTGLTKSGILISLLYLVVILSCLFAYNYFDDRSVDAHLSRASSAKINTDYYSAIGEYRRALMIEDNAHTHKLLADALFNAGYVMEAITEYRAAQEGGEPDDSIHFRLGILLEGINHPAEAVSEYKEFTASETCQQTDPRCDAARERISAAEKLTMSDIR